jgi:hypothetical protein
MVAVGAAIVLALATSGADRHVRADVYVAAIGALGLIEARRALRSLGTPVEGRVDPLVAIPRREPPPRPPGGVLELEGLVEGATYNGRAASLRFAPRARDIARSRLAAHRGIDLDTEPARAEAALGAEVWVAIGPRHGGPLPAPGDPGLEIDTIEAVVLSLERL